MSVRLHECYLIPPFWHVSVNVIAFIECPLRRQHASAGIRSAGMQQIRRTALRAEMPPIQDGCRRAELTRRCGSLEALTSSVFSDSLLLVGGDDQHLDSGILGGITRGSGNA